MTVRHLVRLARPKHWVKNAFVLAPLFFSGHFNELDSNLRTAMAFGAFCLISSATYIFNDISDVEADRAHPVKRYKRPLAAGNVSVRAAWTLFGFLTISAAGMSVLYPRLALVIGAYFALNMLYSKFLKRIAIVDMFVIALGFMLRVYAGASAIEVPVSKWMFVTTFSVALFLAAMKRLQETKTHGAAGREVLEKYTEKFAERVAEISGTLAVVFYSLFTLNDSPGLIITIPVVIFGLIRYWFIADKDGAGESPTDLLYKDRQLQLAAFLLIVISLAVLIFKFNG